jgi:hypothetical protein
MAMALHRPRKTIVFAENWFRYGRRLLPAMVTPRNNGGCWQSRPR